MRKELKIITMARAREKRVRENKNNDTTSG